MGTDTVKHISEILRRINLTELATGNQAVNNGGSFSTGVTSGKEPIFASNGDYPQDTFGKIVVNIEIAIFCVSIQCFPLPTSGTDQVSKSYFGEPLCETIIAGDINGDCKVDLKDLTLLSSHWLEDGN